TVFTTTSVPPCPTTCARPLVFRFFFPALVSALTYTLSLHDALPIFSVPVLVQFFPESVGLLLSVVAPAVVSVPVPLTEPPAKLSAEEHTTLLQSRSELVGRLIPVAKMSGTFAFSVPLVIEVVPVLAI